MKKLMCAVFAIMMLLIISLSNMTVHASPKKDVKVYHVSSVNKVNEDLDDRISFEYIFVGDQEKVVYDFKTLIGENPKVSYNVKDEIISRKEIHDEYLEIMKDLENTLEYDNEDRRKATIAVMSIPIFLAAVALALNEYYI